jgi:hypothetical protein
MNTCQTGTAKWSTTVGFLTWRVIDDRVGAVGGMGAVPTRRAHVASPYLPRQRRIRQRVAEVFELVAPRARA